MFSPAWIDLILIILLVGALLKAPVLLMLGLLLTLTVVISWLWNRNALHGLSYERSFSSQRLFPGDQIEMTISIANRKLLPLAWLFWEDHIPERVQLLQGKLHPSSAAGQRILSRGTTVRWYQRVRWHYPLRCPARGLYSFGPVTIRSGDVFGLFEQSTTLDQPDQILVYPQITPLSELGIPARYLLGETRAPRQLYTDPIRTVGIRDYQPGDSFRHIHWPATARRQQLQVKVYEPVSTLQLAIFLDLDTVAHYWEGLRSEIAEQAISVAASVASAAVESGYAVGLYANGVAAGSDQTVRFAPSRHPGQLGQLLESLAKLVPLAVRRMSDLLPNELPRLARGTTLVLISSLARKELAPVLLRLYDRGRRVVLLYLGETPPALGGIWTHHLGGPGPFERAPDQTTRIVERPPTRR